VHKGHVVFGAMDEVVFGTPAAEAVVAQMDRLRAARAFLMVSGTLNRQTGEIEKIRKALGSRCAATFDAMPPHTPREAGFASPTMFARSKASIRSGRSRASRLT
jgi:maleylacetate reductase